MIADQSYIAHRTLQTKTKERESDRIHEHQFLMLFCFVGHNWMMNRSCWDNSNVMYNSHSDGFYMARTGNRSYRFNSNNNNKQRMRLTCVCLRFFILFRLRSSAHFSISFSTRHKRTTWIKWTKKQIKWLRKREGETVCEIIPFEQTLITDDENFFGNSSKRIRSGQFRWTHRGKEEKRKQEPNKIKIDSNK